MTNGPIHVRVSNEQRLYLEHLATMLLTTKSDLIREAINTWIGHITRLEQIGVIGVSQPRSHI